MKQLFIFSLLLILVIEVFVTQNVEAKVWTKDLVDKVVLTSGYKFDICPISSVQSVSVITANIDITKEEQNFADNPDSIECSGNKEELLIGNTDFYFNLKNWPDATKPATEQLVVFRDKMYNIQGSGTVMPNDKFSVDQDFIATNPGLKYIKRVGIYDTDPNVPDEKRTVSDSTLTVFHNPDGKFSAFLFVFNGQVFKSVAIIHQVTEQTVLVDYTQ